MKKADIGDYLLWNGNLAQVIYKSPEASLGIKILQPNKCPHCDGILEDQVINIIPTSPLFQENAEAINTIK